MSTALRLSRWSDLRPEGQAFALMVEERLRELFPNGWEREKATFVEAWGSIAATDLRASGIIGPETERRVALAVDVACYALVLADLVMREASAEEDLSISPFPESREGEQEICDVVLPAVGNRA